MPNLLSYIRRKVFPNEIKGATAHNSTYPKVGVSCSKDSFVGNGSLVFQIKYSGKNRQLLVAANRYRAF